MLAPSALCNCYKLNKTIGKIYQSTKNKTIAAADVERRIRSNEWLRRVGTGSWMAMQLRTGRQAHNQPKRWILREKENNFNLINIFKSNIIKLWQYVRAQLRGTTNGWKCLRDVELMQLNWAERRSVLRELHVYVSTWSATKVLFIKKCALIQAHFNLGNSFKIPNRTHKGLRSKVWSVLMEPAEKYVESHFNEHKRSLF